MTGYEYDVFISYKFDILCAKWVETHFEKLFGYHLNQVLPGARIYYPPAHAGEDWALKIGVVLAHTKCLVPILTTEYFSADWCVREIETMLDRERKLGFGVGAQYHRLIVPVRAGDGEHYREDIKRIHCHDFRSFVRTGSGFEKSKRYMHFEDTIEEFSKHVAEAIKHAPDWDAEWLGYAVPVSQPSSQPPINQAQM